MLIESDASLEERWLSVFQELGEPEAILACTFTFNAEFFSELLARFAEAACEGGVGEGRAFDRNPVDVVCDRSRYKGHRVGYNVSLWPNASRLFHPKLFIVLFRDEVVWSDGSLNLTPAGWSRNREIAMLHRPGAKSLPRQLRKLLMALPRIAAAEQILSGTKEERSRETPGTFLTSLEAPIGQRFLSGASEDAAEVHLIAPFFEMDESSEPALDESWLRLLVERFPAARFHIYLPQLEADPLRVQGQRRIFASIDRELDQPLSIHPVPPNPGPLHGKLACVVHTPRRTQRAHVLVGSPNMTRSALMAPVRRCNLESAWILDERWKDLSGLFRRLNSKGYALDEVEFIEPTIECKPTWTPLERASYDPLERILRVAWKDQSDAARTVLRYSGRTISVKHGLCRDFELKNDIGWLVTRRKGGGTAEGCCPIDIPVALLPGCRGGSPKRSPEEWLKMLGTEFSDGSELGTRTKSSLGVKDTGPNKGYRWSERVRDLSARIRYLEAELGDESLGAFERDWLLKLIHHIRDSHDPGKAENPHEAVWRVWVRVELWQAIERLAAVSRKGRDRDHWEAISGRMRRRLGLADLSPLIRSQMGAMIGALTGVA